VPSQIHSHLSTDFKDLRNLPADHAMLRAKARDRWFVPDPRKNADVEQLREKRLLEEFWVYMPPGYEPAARRKTAQATLPGMEQKAPNIVKGKRIAIVRTEAVRRSGLDSSRVETAGAGQPHARRHPPGVGHPVDR
jgi:hypothetical protein